MTRLDAVSVPMMSPGDALRLLRKRFPDLLNQFSDPDNPDELTPEPYHSYGRLAREAVTRKTDQNFLNRIAAFMNEITRSREYVLSDLAPEMLEEMVVDQELLRALRPNLDPEVQNVLDEMERAFHGPK